jgi:hypothetical protein
MTTKRREEAELLDVPVDPTVEPVSGVLPDIKRGETLLRVVGPFGTSGFSHEQDHITRQPTKVSGGASRAAELIELAAKHGVAVEKVEV